MDAQYVVFAENVDKALEKLFDVSYMDDDALELVGVLDMSDGTFQFGFNEVVGGAITYRFH